MSVVRKRKILKRRFRFLEKQHRLYRNVERKRHILVRGLRLRQRLRLDLFHWKASREKCRTERRKRVLAKRETAKLNRTLKRRRKK